MNERCCRAVSDRYNGVLLKELVTHNVVRRRLEFRPNCDMRNRESREIAIF